MGVVFTGVGVASEARADDGFALMDRPAPSAGTPVFALDATLLRHDEPLVRRFNALRIDPVATFYYASRRRALYATLPIAIGRQPGQTKLAIANLDVGGFLITRPRPGLRLIIRLGATVPTASSEGDGAATNGVAAKGRVGDLILAMPGTLSARLAVSVLAARREWTARADVGLDQPLAEASRLIDELSRKPVLRANLAIAYVPGRGTTTFGIESVNVVDTGSISDAAGLPDDSVSHQLGLTAGILARKRQIVASLFTDPSTIVTKDDGYSLGVSFSISWPGQGR